MSNSLSQASSSEQNAKGSGGGGVSGGGSKSRRQMSTPGKKTVKAEAMVSPTPSYSNANPTKRQLALAAKKSAKVAAVKDEVVVVTKKEKDEELITGDIDDSGVVKSSAKEFKCEMCSSMFFTQDDLFAHVAIHI